MVETRRTKEAERFKNMMKQVSCVFYTNSRLIILTINTKVLK